MQVSVIYMEAAIKGTRHRDFLGILRFDYPRGVMSTGCSLPFVSTRRNWNLFRVFSELQLLHCPSRDSMVHP